MAISPLLTSGWFYLVVGLRPVCHIGLALEGLRMRLAVSTLVSGPLLFARANPTMTNPSEGALRA